MTLIKFIKGIFFKFSDKESEDIANKYFDLTSLDEFLGQESYFSKKVGDTTECLTNEEMITLVCFDNELDYNSKKHLETCNQCKNRYNELQEINKKLGDKIFINPTSIKSKSHIEH